MGGKGDCAPEYVVNGVCVRAAPAPPARTDADADLLVLAPGVDPPPHLADDVKKALELDPSLATKSQCVVWPSEKACGGRLILASTGEISDYDDIRSISDAWHACAVRAVSAGARRLALHTQPHPRFPRAPLVALLAVLESLYVPLQIRELFPARAHGVSLALVCAHDAPALVADAAALEQARGLARDIGGADPERMTPLRAAAYLRARFEGTRVGVRVEDDPAKLRQMYPLLAAVTRADTLVPRHHGCVVYLEYVPEHYEETIMLVGKGVTYDTGGADVKISGAMAGMSRDKCGAAAAAGLLAAADLLRPPVKILASLGFVRNSVGSDSYVSDELLVSRGGLGVRVGNTDAEGRMVMADLLTEMRERAAGERSPHIYTVATLTGHAVRAMGPGYTVAIDNHVARARGHAARLRTAGEALADMFEVSTLRREDLQWHRGRAPGDHLHQAASLPSTQQPRGHQAPAAFLLLVAGLEAGAVPYTHLDVAASAGEPPQEPSAAPLLALAHHYRFLHSQ